MNEEKKVIDVIWIYSYIMKNKRITTKIIMDNLVMTDRQLWRYMADIKAYFSKYTGYQLVYSKKNKEYSLTEAVNQI